jgi:hypothetical protein
MACHLQSLIRPAARLSCAWQKTKTLTKTVMPKYVIERNIPNLGKLSARELHDISGKSCRVLHDLGPQIQWIQSYVTAEKMFCIYIAPNPEMVREHATRGNFPADAIREVKTIIDPTTAE